MMSARLASSPRGMLFTALRQILAHKLRLVATALAVTLGVAFMAGTLVLTDTVTRTFDDLFGDVNRNTDVVVRAESAFDGPQGMAQRPRIEAGLVEAVRKVPGVAAAEGDVFGYARIIGSDGKALGNPANGAPTLGMSWPELAELNPFVLVEGRAPRAADEIVIDAKSARDGALAVGRPTTVLVHGPPLTAKIVGIAKFGTADSPGGATVAAFELSAAQRLVGEAGRYDSIAVVGAGGVSQADLAARVQQALPKGTEAVTGATVTKENQDTIHEALGFFTTFMLVFAGVALLVGAFMIYNTFSITVAQRMRENGLLRAVGASRRQVLAAVLLEALAVGLIASVLGLGLGVAVAAGLKELLDALGFEIPAGGLVFARRTAILAPAVGVAVTLAAAFGPARRAAGVAPVAALHGQTETATAYGSRRRVAAGLALLSAGVAALTTGLTASVSHRLSWVGAGVVAIFFAVSVLGRTIARPLSAVLGWPLPRLRGAAGDIARQNAMRNPRRTAATASALMIGVGLVGFITIFVASSKASVSQVVERAFIGDLVLDSGASIDGGINPGLAVKLDKLGQVATATGVRVTAAKINGEVTEVAAVDPAEAFKVADIGVLSGSPAETAKGLAVHQDEAAEKGLALGDKVPVVFKDTGETELPVTLIYRDAEVVGPYLLGRDAYDANVASRYDWQVWVKGAEGVDPAQLRAAVEKTAAAYPGVDVLTRDEFTAKIMAPMDQMLALVYALLALAIVIALLGIANTLALSTFERLREIGLLRAVGMTRRQLRSSIRWEAVIIAVQGTLLGLCVGVFFGWALVRALHDDGITVFRVPVASMLVIVLVAAFAGVLAAFGPSRRAARLNVLRAISSH